ncbi:MAG: CNNM domain-containing protein [Bdellovibrionota bacterium]
MEEIIVIIVCLLLNALLAGAEMAFVTIPKPRLRDLSRNKNIDAQRILKLRENPERTLSVIQIGITLVGALAAAVGGAGAEESISPILQARFDLQENTAEFLSIVLIVIPLTYFSVVIGELVPKTLALRNPVGIALKSARWLTLFERIFAPVISSLEWSTKTFLKVFFKRAKIDPQLTQPDTVELDQLSQQARQYVINLVNVEKKRVKDVSLAWEQVTAVNGEQSVLEVEKVIITSGHTRLPVLSEGKLAGIINTKEFMSLRAAGREDWTSIVRSVVQVREGDPLLKALRMMQEKRSHLSIVYAGNNLAGIVTMEDILEEIIGDILDEDDDGALRRILSTGSTFRTIGPSLE